MRSFRAFRRGLSAVTTLLSAFVLSGEAFPPGMLTKTVVKKPCFAPPLQMSEGRQQQFCRTSSRFRRCQRDRTAILFTADVSKSSDQETENGVKPKYTHDNPRFFNSHGFRALAAASTLYLVGYASGIAKSPVSLIKSKQTLATVHLLAFGVWFGSIVYSTFVGGITMVKNLPRPMFAEVQSKLFPKFFKLCFASILFELATVSGLSVSLQNNLVMKSVLFVSLAATMSNMVFFGPRTTAVMKTRIDLEQSSGGTSSEAYKQAKKEFMKYHAGSSIANLVAMCGAIGHAMQLAFPLST